MVGRAITLLGIILCASSSACESECKSHSDCISSEAAQDLGRCFPRDAWCSDGVCHAACAQLCNTVDERVTVCEAHTVCTDRGLPKDEQEAFCTSVPIACKDPGDCPIYRPGEDTWRCEHGICTFPGFKYASER